MLASLAGTDPVVRATFDEASAVLGYDLWQLVQEGPAGTAERHRVHPARHARGGRRHLAALARRAAGRTRPWCPGHSLGEFTALVARGALDFASAIDLVRFRGQAMQEAVPAGTGAMAAILGLDDAQVVEACSEAAQGGVVEAVNFNSPGRSSSRARPPPCSAPSRLRESAWAPSARSPCLSAFRRTAVSCASAARALRRAARDSGDPPAAHPLHQRGGCRAFTPIRRTSARCSCGSSRARCAGWTPCARIAATGITQLIECGPGKVLTGLNKRIEGVSGVQLRRTRRSSRRSMPR